MSRKNLPPPTLQDALARYGELDALIAQTLAALPADRPEGMRLAAGVVQKVITLDRILDVVLPELHDDDVLHPRHRLVRPGNSERPPVRYVDGGETL